jgi:hypothetical protein
VAGLLNFLFIRPEIKQQIGLRHDESLRCRVAGSQGGAGVNELRRINVSYIGWAGSAVLAYHAS